MSENDSPQRHPELDIRRNYRIRGDNNVYQIVCGPNIFREFNAFLQTYEPNRILVTVVVWDKVNCRWVDVDSRDKPEAKAKKK